MTKLNVPRWQGRKILKEEDAHDLEHRAALNEFQHRMSREDAEHRAHFEYTREKLKEAAAHHLAGMKAASAAGSTEEGRKHGVMYQMVLDRLGHDPMGPVPPEIQSLVQKQQDKFYRFKPHKADSFLLQDEEEPKKE